MTDNNSNIDIHICGACKTQFHDVELFLMHKRQSCPMASKTATKQIHTESQPQLQSSPQLHIQAPGQPQIQVSAQPQIQASPQLPVQSHPHVLEPVTADHASHSHNVQNGAGTDVPYMVTPITPPLGHEYVQTAQKQRTPKSQFMNHVLLTDKGEIIIVQDKSALPYTDQNFYQQHGENMISMIQQQLVAQNSQSQVQPQIPTQVQLHTQAIPDGKPTEQVLFTNGSDSAQEQAQVFQQEVGQDNSAPRMQLDHNGSYSLIPSSQIPANLQLSVNSQQTQLPVSHVINAETGADDQQSANQHLVLKQLLNSGQNQVIIQQIQQQQQIQRQQQQIQQQQIQQIQQPQQQFMPSNQLTDLAQQAAVLSGVEPGFQNLSAGEITTNSEQQQALDNQQYSVHIRTVDQPGTDVSVIENVMQVKESYIPQIQDNTVSGTQQPDVLDVQEFEDDAISPTQPSLENARQMFISSIESSQKSKLPVHSNSGDTPKKPKRVRPKKFRCTFNDTCTYISTFQKDLERHMRTHTGEKPFICEYCKKGFSRVDKLRLHIRAHVGDKPFKCELCDYSSVDSSGLKKHMVTHTRDRKHKCQVCPYACRSASQLTVHLRVHTGDCPFPCPFCQSKFKIKSDLRRHIRVHTGEKPYVCEECGAKCATNGNLASHIKVHHSQDKQIKCTQCDFSSSSKRILREHLKTHEPENPDTTCPICDYQCANKEVLKNHLITHKTEKEFVCSHCNFSTKHKANLVIHIRRKHINILSKKAKDKKGEEKSSKLARIKIGNTYSSKRFEKQFHCDLCDESFVRKDSLNSHKRLHEEMAKSTLSTALTVLRLQQPVINVTTSQTIPTGLEAASGCGEQVNKNLSETVGSDINEISIIEKRGISNTNIENGDVTIQTQLTNQVDFTSATTSAQPLVNNEMILSQNFKQRIPVSLSSNSIQIEQNISQHNNGEQIADTGISENQHLDSQEVTSTSIPAAQADITNGVHTEHENGADFGHPGTNVVINIEGQGQSTVGDPSHQDSEMIGNVQNLTNCTLSPQQSSVTLPSPLCQIPGIQLVQNISFPLFRLPSGQLIPAFSGQPTVQGTSPGDVQQNIPVQIFPCGDQQSYYTGTRTVEPYSQFINSSGQQIQAPVQLVLAASAANNTTGNQSEGTLTQNSVQEVTSSTEICTSTVDNQQTSEQTNVITLPIRMDMTNQSVQDGNGVSEN